MSCKERLIKLLQDQYGIYTEEQLDQAIRDLPPLDISIFVAELPERNEDSCKDRKTEN